MRARQIFEYALVELNKRNAPSLLLEDYNYFINKAILQYVNKMYNAYDINQQKTDDLRILKSSAVLTPTLSTDYGTSTLFHKTYEVVLPDDYLHILNCVVEYQVLKNFKCYQTGDYWHQGAKRLTADMFPQLINNYYERPSYKNPYFYINNVTTKLDHPTTDDKVNITIADENAPGVRYGNKSQVRMEIRYGKDNAVFQLHKVFIDYLKVPEFVLLTQDQVDMVEDTSQILEYPDYVIQEIINELVKLLMENSMDPRLQTNIPINQSIAPPMASQPQK